MHISCEYVEKYSRNFLKLRGIVTGIAERTKIGGNVFFVPALFSSLHFFRSRARRRRGMVCMLGWTNMNRVTFSWYSVLMQEQWNIEPEISPGCLNFVRCLYVQPMWKMKNARFMDDNRKVCATKIISFCVKWPHLSKIIRWPSTKYFKLACKTYFLVIPRALRP